MHIKNHSIQETKFKYLGVNNSLCNTTVSGSV